MHMDPPLLVVGNDQDGDRRTRAGIVEALSPLSGVGKIVWSSSLFPFEYITVVRGRHALIVAPMIAPLRSRGESVISRKDRTASASERGLELRTIELAAACLLPSQLHPHPAVESGQ
jgi:hypothetical protein